MAHGSMYTAMSYITSTGIVDPVVFLSVVMVVIVTVIILTIVFCLCWCIN